LSNNTVLSLLVDKKGFLWVGTNSGGLNKYDSKSNVFYRYEKDPDDVNSLSHNIIWSLFQDKSGIIWIGSFGGGINKIDPDKERFELYQAKKCDLNTLSSNMITSFAEDHKGLLWIGTFGGGLNCFDRKNKTYNYFLDIPNTNKSIIRRIYEDSRKRLWVSTEECIYLFDQNRTHYTEIKVFANDILNYPTYAICEDSKGNIWLGTWNDGLKKIDAKYTGSNDFKNVPIISYKYDENNPNSLPDNVVWDIVESSTGEIWLATGTGVRLFDTKNNRFINYLKDNQTNLDFGYNTSCLLEDKQGNIWFGTFGIGFYKIDKKNKSYLSFNKKTGYDITEVLSIIEDNNNCLWLSTNKGIAKFEQSSGKIYNYGVSDGLQASLFYKGAYCKLNSGEIAFGGINGFNIFNPDSIAISSYIPPVYITDIKLFNKSVTLEKAEEGNVLFNKPTYKISDIELSYSQNVFSIDFAALDYSSPDKINYAHKMEGFDNDWIYTNGKNHSATYTNLRGGEYVFRIKATNKDGIWSDKETTLNIKITPPFWRTTWFKLILSALFGYLLYLLFKYRLNILQKRFEKESLHKEREIVKLKNDKLNTDLDFKTKELAQSTMHVIRKNEDMIEIRNIINEVVPLSTNEGKSKLTKLLRHIDSKLDDSSNWEYFEYNFNLIHNNFLKRFAEQYPDINHNDLKICAYIRMNLSTKEIANLLNISYRTIESTRYRIRKKINIDTDITLNDYIMRF
jgi:DNA-binding CsgD family transcriptional regulator